MGGGQDDQVACQTNQGAGRRVDESLGGQSSKEETQTQLHRTNAQEK